jgi:hypothetical protein
MRPGLSDAHHRRGLRTSLKALLLGAVLCLGTQAQAQNCRDVYASIKNASMHCGFFCDQDELRPLIAKYEAQCVVRVIPASLVPLESSLDATTTLAAHTERRSEETASHPVVRNSQRLLETLQTIGTSQFVSSTWRKSSAEEFLGYCKAALARVRYTGPHVGLTEESSSPAGAELEFARWRLNTIFGDCTEVAHDILDAQNVQREVRAWIKLTQLLEYDETVRKLGASAQLAPSAADKDNVFGTDNWRTMRGFIFEAVTKLLGSS